MIKFNKLIFVIKRTDGQKKMINKFENRAKVNIKFFLFVIFKNLK